MSNPADCQANKLFNQTGSENLETSFMCLPLVFLAMLKLAKLFWQTLMLNCDKMAHNLLLFVSLAFVRIK